VGKERLRLEEFKVLYRHWSTGIVWFDHLLLGLLVWLEERLIDARVKAEVDHAIEEYEKIEVSMPDYVSPIYTERPVETSTSLPEMRLTAPWYSVSDDKK